jgi:hypothetical protein
MGKLNLSMIARVVATLAAFVAVGFCAAVWHYTPKAISAAGKPVQLDTLSLQIDILSLTLSALGIGLAVIGLFGYQALKEAAELRAERAASDVAAKKADEVATRAVAEHIEKLEARFQGLSANRSQDAASANVDDVILERGKEDGDGRNN